MESETDGRLVSVPVRFSEKAKTKRSMNDCVVMLPDYNPRMLSGTRKGAFFFLEGGGLIHISKICSLLTLTPCMPFTSVLYTLQCLEDQTCLTHLICF